MGQRSPFLGFYIRVLRDKMCPLFSEVTKLNGWNLSLGVRRLHTESGSICVRRISPVRITRHRELVDSFTSWARKEEREKVREAFYDYYLILFMLMLLEFCELSSVGSCVPTITIKTRNSSSPNMSVCSRPSAHILAAMNVFFAKLSYKWNHGVWGIWGLSFFA